MTETNGGTALWFFVLELDLDLGYLEDAFIQSDKKYICHKKEKKISILYIYIVVSIVNMFVEQVPRQVTSY